MAKMKACTECQGEIPKKAKKCMHCGSKQAQGMGCGGFIVVSFVTIYIVYSFMSMSDKTPQTVKTPKTAAQIASEKERSQAEKACMARIKRTAKFPSSVDFSMFDTPRPSPIQGGGWIVRWAFEAKNGYGNLIPQTSYCEVKDGKIQQFSVMNR